MHGKMPVFAQEPPGAGKLQPHVAVHHTDKLVGMVRIDNPRIIGLVPGKTPFCYSLRVFDGMESDAISNFPVMYKIVDA